MATLYIIGTPIGNLKDITLRALETLKEVDVIACEDTRHSLRLLNSFEIKKKLISCRSHNEAKGASQVVRYLEDDMDVAYVSDAGTPGLSDPGAVVVRTVRAAGFPVVPIPGPSALASLQSVSSFGDKTVTFDGFLSPKPGRRKRRVGELLDRAESFVLYESPFRIVKLLQDIADLDSEREVLVGREMTKVYEEFLEGTAQEVIEVLNSRPKVQGEFSVLVRGRKKS